MVPASSNISDDSNHVCDTAYCSTLQYKYYIREKNARKLNLKFKNNRI